MSVVVAHDGRQHVGRLLIALEQRGWLRCFYNGLATNGLPAFLWRSARLKPTLQKRIFDQIPARRIRSCYLSALLTRLSADGYWQVGVAYRLFGYWVALGLRRRPDFQVLIGYENTNLASFRMARRLGRITVLDLSQVHHGLIDDVRRRFPVDSLTDAQQRYINRRKQLALDQTNYILSLSAFATHSLVRHGIARDRIYEVNLGVDSARFSPAPKPDDGRFRLLFVGTLTRRKGVDQLLAAFEQLALPNADLTLIGPPGDAASLLTPCRASVRYLPFLPPDELVSHYQRANVFVFPSYLDSWGQVVLEAMACGTPVIVSDHTGAKEAVAKGGGLVIATGDGAALRDALRYLHDHENQARRMGREARRVAEQYTWANYYQQVTNALSDVARREQIVL